MRRYLVTLYTLNQFHLSAYSMTEAAEKATLFAKENYEVYDILSITVVFN